jgi:SAM-dependent methyltransferase
MAVADDHDLAVRMFLAGSTFHHIHECLYLYRVHGANTVSTRNAAIRAGTGRVYERSIWPLAEHWCKEKELLRIDLGGALDCPPGYTPVDRNPGPGVLVADLEGRWPMADSSVGILRAHDALEHFKDPVHTMNEAHRVLAPGGFFMISVPSTSGKGAWCDPTHKSWWNDLSFRYYTSARFARYVPAFHGRFQTSRVIEWYPSEWHREADVPYVEAHLFCVKDGFRAMGEWGWG